MAGRHPAPLSAPFHDPPDGDAEDLVALLGGKGAGLADMTALGLPVPAGFTLTTEAWRRLGERGWDDILAAELQRRLAELEQHTGRRLGDPAAPLLVSVRSGAPASMPGMLSTVLGVGMTDAVADGLGALTDDPDFAADTRRRSVRSYADAVGGPPPDDPAAQLTAAVQAVFESWSSPRARRYRAIEQIDGSIGTAATVQAMVFGNLGDDSGTAVAFTRDPSTGIPGLMGDLLVGMQGDDVVGGSHRPRPLGEMADRWPSAWAELRDCAGVLERRFADMVDIELTVERGKLWLLQVRRATRSPLAAFRAAVDMADDAEFPVDRTEAIRRCTPLLAEPPTIAADLPVDGATVVAEGLAAGPGHAVGRLCLDVDEAVALRADGIDVVLVRAETSPADVHGLAASVGLVTTRGGLVSHAAIVARAWGLPAVVGAEDLVIVAGGVRGRGHDVPVGAVVTVDGDRGRLLLGAHGAGGDVPDVVRTVQRWASEDGG